MSQYKCKYFDIKELVPPEVYYERGEKAWALFDDRALRMLDALRERFGKTTVNNWSFGGAFVESGLRTVGCKHYRAFSAHSFGRAFDCKFEDVTPAEVEAYILENPDEFPCVQRLESTRVTKTWLHFDVGNYRHTGIYVFHP